MSLDDSFDAPFRFLPSYQIFPSHFISLSIFLPLILLSLFSFSPSLFFSLSVSLFLAHIIFTSHKILFFQNFDAIIKACLVSLGTLTVPSREEKNVRKEESSDTKVLIGCHMSHSFLSSQIFLVFKFSFPWLLSFLSVSFSYLSFVLSSSLCVSLGGLHLLLQERHISFPRIVRKGGRER